MRLKKIVLAPLLVKIFAVVAVAGAATTAGVVGSRAADSPSVAPDQAPRAAAFDPGVSAHLLAAEENAQADVDQGTVDNEDQGAVNSDQGAVNDDDQGAVNDDDQGAVGDEDQGEVEDEDEEELEDEDEEQVEDEEEVEDDVEVEGDEGSDD